LNRRAYVLKESSASAPTLSARYLPPDQNTVFEKDCAEQNTSASNVLVLIRNLGDMDPDYTLS
jgi:hypothetical protein